MNPLDLMRAGFGSQFSFSAASSPEGLLSVAEFNGQEEISQPFQYTITLFSEQSAIPLAKFAGEPALLTLRDFSGVRYVHGVIERFRQLSSERLGALYAPSGKAYSYYQATLIPTMATLRYRKTSRIFQDMATLAIIKKVFADAGLPEDLLQPSLSGEYSKRGYCVQYQESDFHFISRLLEEEGIAYYFMHSKDKDVMVLADSAESFGPIANAPMLPFRENDPNKSTALHKDVVYEFQSEAAMHVGTLRMQDYRFKHPDMDLSAEQSGEEFKQYEHYLYPGEYVEPELGKRLATVRLEEMTARRQNYVGLTTSRSLEPGHLLTLVQHPQPEYNQQYLIVGVSQSGSQRIDASEQTLGGLSMLFHRDHSVSTVMSETAQAVQNMVQSMSGATHEAKFMCVPSSVTFRPRRVTDRPVIPGLQSAVVVGPKGEEIHCDEHGRIKIQFQWDRGGKQNENSSCWVRICQPWAGARFGFWALPRIGQEVMVQFLEGDPDRPIVIGSVYNGNNQVPYDLPGGKTRSTWRTKSTPKGEGANELRFEDSKGHEEIYLHAEKDHNEVVKNNHTVQVGSSQTVSVAGSVSITVDKGKYTVTANTEQIEFSTTKNHYHVTAKTALIEAANGMRLQSGDSFIEITPQGIYINGPLITSEATGEHVIKGLPVKINC
ncbi:MAG: type VI secretion system tip protein TssI/VgrG [Polyangia bacterium]